ncbi:MAG TPA: hypothetical protein VIG33_14835 [Pseudobdellovibrionaceae bacterium]|jgi:hypothetical protein
MITQKQKITGTVVDSEAVTFDMANLTAVEFQVTTTGTATSGTYKIQKSNDGTHWVDIASATGAFTTATTLMTTCTGVVASQVRLLWGLASGTVTYVMYIQGKELV